MCEMMYMVSLPIQVYNLPALSVLPLVIAKQVVSGRSVWVVFHS